MPQRSFSSEFERAIGESGVLLIGGGGHALVVADAAEGMGMRVIGCLDDDREPVLSREPGPHAKLGALADATAWTDRARWILAFGSIEGRRAFLKQRATSSAKYITISHGTAYVCRSAEIDLGGFIGPKAVINARARIGPHAIINTGAIVEHECRLGENIHIAPGAVLGGRVSVGPDTLIGIGARVIPGISIGSGVTVGAGAVVIRDVPDGAKVVGCPGRVI